MLDWSLLTGPIPVALRVTAIAASAWLLCQLPWRRSPYRAAITLTACTVIAVAATAVSTHLARTTWALFPDQLEPAVYGWVGAGILALAITAASVLGARTLRRSAVGLAAAFVVVAACANQVNTGFAAYPTVRAAFGIEPPGEVPFGDIAPAARLLADLDPVEAHWTPPPGLPTRGTLTSAPIPGPSSRFTARDAEIYLPPAYFADPRPQLPVLVLLAGQPGSPQDWVSAGKLTETMDGFAAAHRGLAPVVVVADGTGSPIANPLCMNSRLGNADTYLSVDVPAWINTHLTVDPSPHAWAVGGLSYGGTCALQLATNHPQTFPTFLDFSGAAEPSLGDRRRTLAAAFGGDLTAFGKVNPLDLLRTQSYRGTAGSVVVGSADEDTKPDARTVADAVYVAGADVRYIELPGTHSWQVWSAALAHEMPWLAARLGLTGYP